MASFMERLSVFVYNMPFTWHNLQYLIPETIAYLEWKRHFTIEILREIHLKGILV